MVADPYTGYLYGETYTIAGNTIADPGCTAISKTEEYCENPIGGTSLASPLMAGVMAVMNQKREAHRRAAGRIRESAALQRRQPRQRQLP